MSDTVDQETVYRVDPNVRFRRLFDEAVVLHQRRAETMVLNDTGVAFLELCDGRRATREIVAALCEQFDVDEPTLAEDLGPFLQEMRSAEVIVAIDRPEGS